QRGIEARLVPAEGYSLTLLAAPSLRPAGAGPLAALRDGLRLLRSIPQVIQMIRRVKPDVIFSTGGYIAIPVLIAAAVTRTPSLMWEGNVQAGRSNTLVAPLATLRAVAWDATRQRAPWNGTQTRTTGTPVRSLAGVDRTVARQGLGLSDRDRLLLVFGGSQYVRRFDLALDSALEHILEDWHVLHVVGDAVAAAEHRAHGLPAGLRGRYNAVPFLADGAMERALVAADVLLGRSGASTVAEASIAGLPSILVPYPFAGGHQRANAEALAAAGGATLIDDQAFNEATLRAALAPLADAATRARIGAAAAGLARPDAADVIAHMLIHLGGRRD
ncbi:MAG: UDP-N-acetylglucosamine--N-acetylmuramyl-(pentapeptide) pyrophosphoryl-undecaprenol N-acetylglucosamine transferase, partial [Candidatus Limnocylindrus sp.]